MNRTELVALIQKKKSFLCVGLDSDPSKLPMHIDKAPGGVLQFNKAIIDATLPYAISFKLNIAFYEAMGIDGWKVLKETIDYIPKSEALIIADAKRGDIGNTAKQYAKAFFETLDCHAITVNPYMGSDSVTPFLEYKDNWTIALGLTSNKGAMDIEMLKLQDGQYVYEAAIKSMAKYGSADNLMFVVGATQADQFSAIRQACPNHFLLVPGVGAQGGTLESLKPLMTNDCGLIVNSSRQIIFASDKADFAKAAANSAASLQSNMAQML